MATELGLRELLFQWDEMAFHPGPRGEKVRMMGLDGAPEAGKPAVVFFEFPPHYVLPRHYHPVPHIEIILAGEVQVGEYRQTAGTIRHVPAGTFYGPFKAGPEGVKAMEIFPDGDLAGVFGGFEDPNELEKLGLTFEEFLDSLRKFLADPAEPDGPPPAALA